MCDQAPSQVNSTARTRSSVTESDQVSTRPTKTSFQSGIRKEKIYTDGTIKYGCLASTGEPTNEEEALGDENWKGAMKAEYDALVKNNTWRLVPPQKGNNVIGCKWVYKIKRVRWEP